MAEQEGPWFVSAEDYARVVAERDRARDTAVRLEQELAQVTAERDALAGLSVLMDKIATSRREGWRPAGGLVSE